MNDDDMPARAVASERYLSLNKELKAGLTAGAGRGAFGGATAEYLYAARVGGGRGSQGGPTAAELNPITPTAESATQPQNETIVGSVGSPPEVLYFYGYSEDGSAYTTTVQNIRRVPVVITSVGITYPNDVDYIPTLDGVPFPTVMNITLELKETKSPHEIEQFSLADFKAGRLIGW